MARPREFDEMTVLEAAMNCFWAQGFEQTSDAPAARGPGKCGQRALALIETGG